MRAPPAAGDTLWTAHVGDSRAVLLRKGQQLEAVRLTQDHKPDLPRERSAERWGVGRRQLARADAPARPARPTAGSAWRRPAAAWSMPSAGA